MGLDPSGPMWWKPIMLNSAPSAAPFTLWDRHDLYGWTFRVTVWYYLGLTVKENLGRRLKINEVDGSPGGNELRLFDDRLSSIYEHATCRFSIGFSIGSNRRFVFRALQIYIYNTSPSSFLHFIAKTHCQSATVNLVRALRRTSMPIDYTTVDLQLLQRTVSIAILIYKSCICNYI